MNAKRIATHLTSVVLLLLWGGVMLYFHLSGRMGAYLPQTGIFRPMALYAGIALIALGIFNLATMGADDVLGTEDKDKDADHAHKDGDCCGHCHAPSSASDEASSSSGRWLAMLILALPLLVAAVFSPDRFSPAAIINKGVYSARYDTAQPPPSSRLSSSKAKVAAPAPAPVVAKAAPTPASAATGTLAVTPSAGPRVPGSAAPATSSVVVTTLPPASALPPAATTPSPAAGAPPAGAPVPAAAGAAGGKSYGSFTLEDLKSQVPMSKEGNFILEVPELYYTAGDKEVQNVITGQSVETTAQVLPEKVNNADGKRLRVFRLLVQCCASDARP